MFYRPFQNREEKQLNICILFVVTDESHTVFKVIEISDKNQLFFFVETIYWDSIYTCNLTQKKKENKHLVLNVIVRFVMVKRLRDSNAVFFCSQG